MMHGSLACGAHRAFGWIRRPSPKRPLASRRCSAPAAPACSVGSSARPPIGPSGPRTGARAKAASACFWPRGARVPLRRVDRRPPALGSRARPANSQARASGPRAPVARRGARRRWRGECARRPALHEAGNLRSPANRAQRRRLRGQPVGGQAHVCQAPPCSVCHPEPACSQVFARFCSTSTAR